MAKKKGMAPTRMPPLSDHELVEYSGEHLCYELSMFFEAGYRFMRFPEAETAAEKAIRNMFFESFVLHFRNLVEFLYQANPRPDDVIAADFLLDPKGWAPQPISNTLKTAWERSHKELAHLTTGRLPETSKHRNWPAAALIDEILALMQQFNNVASPDRLHSCVNNVLSQQPPTATAPGTVVGSATIVGGTRSTLSWGKAKGVGPL